MARKMTPESKRVHFILKVVNINHRVSALVGELFEKDSYYHSFRTVSLVCEAIIPSDMMNIQLYLDIACSRHPFITPEELEEWANSKIPYELDKSMKQTDKERLQLIKENRPSSFGHIHKFNGVWRGYVSLEPDIWLASHILLCSGKACYVSLLTHRKPRKRDYMVHSFSVSTEQDE